jgi:hypothetical protein
LFAQCAAGVAVALPRGCAGGYGVNSGAGNRDWWFLGWRAQRQVLHNLAAGAEIYHRPAIAGPTRFQTYFAYQLTFGPGK